MKTTSTMMIAIGLMSIAGATEAAPTKASPIEGSGANGQAPASFGMEAKRNMKHWQDEVLPKEAAYFKEKCGFDVAVDVDWASFPDAESVRALSSNRGLHELMEAFHGVCRDQVGKDAVKKGVQRIAYKNIADKANKNAKLEAGVLKIEGAFNGKDLIGGTLSSAAYKEVLIKKL